MVGKGHRAVMLFILQRMDFDASTACPDLDPAYASGLTKADAAGWKC